MLHTRRGPVTLRPRGGWGMHGVAYLVRHVRSALDDRARVQGQVERSEREARAALQRIRRQAEPPER